MEKKSLTGLPNHKRTKYGLTYQLNKLGIFTNFPVYIYYKKQQQQLLGIINHFPLIGINDKYYLNTGVDQS